MEKGEPSPSCRARKCSRANRSGHKLPIGRPKCPDTEAEPVRFVIVPFALSSWPPQIAGKFGVITCRGPKGASISFRTSGSQAMRSEEHTSELQSRLHLVCRLL